jgi:hypothetical protein
MVCMSYSVLNHLAANIVIEEVRFKKILEETDYRDEYYFVAQLYEANWKLRATT